MLCPACQTENRAQNKFCGECGARLPLTYPGWADPNEPTQKFCGECGGRLHPATEIAPAFGPQSQEAAPVATAASPLSGASTVLQSAAPVTYTPRHLVEKILTSKAAIEGERKIVTVMFTDVSGFTAMSEKLDPEEVHAIMDRAFKVIIDAVHRQEGTINQFLGDGVMALFGAPIAHESHAERALSAALAIQEGLKPLAADVLRDHGVEFRMRMGMNTGLVLVGAIGSDLRMDYTAMGDTVNLAARLLGIAKPGQIVVSRRTRELREQSFTFEDLGEFQVKGKTEPVRAYAVIGESRGGTRLEVSKDRKLTPLFGRVRELNVFEAAWSNARSGRGGVVLLSGEAGVGKSRLLYEFLQRLGTGARQVETTCVSFGRSMAYRPILELLRNYFAFTESVTGEEIRSRVAEHLRSQGVEGDEPAVLLAHFLGASAPEDFLNRLTGAQLKDRTLNALRDVLLRASDSTPLVVIVENMHWIDTASEEFLAHLARTLPGHRVLLVLTSRPGYAASWLAPPLAETITLASLETGDVRGMVRTLLAAEEVSEQLLKILAEKGEGNPLYVEEILRQLLETNAIVVANGEARLSRPDVTVPATIHDIIAARTDRLAESLKRTLQVAAVVGRRFGVTLVSRVLQIVPDQVAGNLQELHALDFVFPSAQDPELMYSFKHALTQEVVYSGVLERRRRQYHTAAARGLEELYSERVNDVVELLGYHFGRGQVWHKAAIYQRQGAVKAQGKSAHREALASFEEALEALRRLPDTPESREQGIDVRLELRGSLYPLGEFGRMMAYLGEAEAMASAISDEGRLGLVCIHTAEYLRQTGRFAEARTLAEKALAMGDKLQDVPLQSYAGQYFGLACHALGDYRRASELLRVVTQSPQPERWAGAFGMVSSWDAHQAISHAWFARCLAELGEFDEGVDAGRRAVVLAEGLNSPYSLTAACIGLGYICLVKGDIDAAGPVLERACSIAREANLALYRPQATRLLGNVYLLAGRIDEGFALVRAAAEEVESKRLLMQHAAVLALFGEACLFAGKVDEASTAAQRALTLAKERDQRGDAAAALHVLGQVAARDPVDIDRAEHHYRAAIALAGELDMRPLLARSHLGIGRLYVSTKDRERAEDHLLKATRLFIAMDTPFWLQQAVASLRELGRLLIVARDHRSLYEYLTRALAPQAPLRVILDAPAGELGTIDERRRKHVEEMLQAHGLGVVGE